MAIEKGGQTAWQVRALIEAWLNPDEAAMRAALDDAHGNLSDVVKYLLIVAGGGLEAFAIASGQPYETVQASVFTQLAARHVDVRTSEVMRTAITAWASGDEAVADAVNQSGIFQEVEPDGLILELLGFIEMLGRELTERLGKPMSYATDGWWQGLGVVGPWLQR